ncbi:MULTISPECIES: hypothetical protein [unclassified Streptomyces]|uniref:hypothetical protein n=1 Tax=unclassified Streptomyces TaxID=2593676 RepID=UPI003427C42E
METTDSYRERAGLGIDDRVSAGGPDSRPPPAAAARPILTRHGERHTLRAGLSRRLGIMVDVLLQIGEDFDWPETDGSGVIIR